MKIANINLKNEGYIHCRSLFYSSKDILPPLKYDFNAGINMLNGDIDSGVWAISYLISMYKYYIQDFILFNEAIITVNQKNMQLNEFSSYSCYMDNLYPLFSNEVPIKTIISNRLKEVQSKMTVNDIKNLFHLDSERFERSVQKAGNERFRAMAAIGYVYNKQVFCFPWLSEKRFDYYHKNITDLLYILKSLDTVVIFPVGKNDFNIN